MVKRILQNSRVDFVLYMINLRGRRAEYDPCEPYFFLTSQIGKFSRVSKGHPTKTEDSSSTESIAHRYKSNMIKIKRYRTGKWLERLKEKQFQATDIWDLSSIDCLRDGKSYLRGDITVCQGIGPGQVPGVLLLAHTKKQDVELRRFKHGRPKQSRNLHTIRNQTLKKKPMMKIKEQSKNPRYHWN